jgi:hypothetical protein
MPSAGWLQILATDLSNQPLQPAAGLFAKLAAMRLKGRVDVARLAPLARQAVESVWQRIRARIEVEVKLRV